MDDLAAEIKGGKMDFDVVIASPDTMRVVGTLGQILGPRGLMPNPKVGTVTPDVAQAVRNAKAGQVQFRVDKAGIVHAHDRPPLVRVGQAGRQPARADRGAEQGQAGVEQGDLPAQGGGVVDHGRRRPGRRRDDQRGAGGRSLRGGARRDGGPRPPGDRQPRAIEDRWCEPVRACLMASADGGPVERIRDPFERSLNVTCPEAGGGRGHADERSRP